MKETIQEIAERIDRVIASRQWKAFAGSISGRMALGDTTSFEAKEKLGDGVLSIVLHYEKGREGLSLSAYDGKIVRQPPFEHGVVAGIDSHELERLMKELDFTMGFADLQRILVLEEKEKAMLIWGYHSVFDCLGRLEASVDGKPIAEALKMKYLVGTAYEKEQLNADLRQRFITERRFNAVGSDTFSFREAINLLAGRAVYKPYVTLEGNEKLAWFTAGYDPNQKDNRYFFSGGQSVFPDYDLRAALRSLPVVFRNGAVREDIIHALQKGDLQKVGVVRGGKDTTFFIQADPGNRGVAILDESMRPVARKQMLIEPGRDSKRLVQKKKSSRGLKR